MDWSTCRGRFKEVSVHANMTLLIGGLMDSLWIAQNHKKIITPANGIMFQHHILTEHKQDSSINAMNFWTGTMNDTPPRPRIISPVHWHLWKTPAGLSWFRDWYAYAHVSIPRNYTIECNYTGYVHACVNAPRLFAIGQFRSNGSILSCTVVCILV